MLNIVSRGNQTLQETKSLPGSKFDLINFFLANWILSNYILYISDEDNGTNRSIIYFRQFGRFIVLLISLRIFLNLALYFYNIGFFKVKITYKIGENYSYFLFQDRVSLASSIFFSAFLGEGWLLPVYIYGQILFFRCLLWYDLGQITESCTVGFGAVPSQILSSFFIWKERALLYALTSLPTLSEDMHTQVINNTLELSNNCQCQVCFLLKDHGC